MSVRVLRSEGGGALLERLLLAALLAAFLTICVGCEGDPKQAAPQAGPGATPPGPGRFGDRCKRAEDCASALCVPVDVRGGVCTSVCTDAAACPQSPNWACAQPDGLGTKVCGCTPGTASEVCGDAIDNDCDGKIDDCQTCDGVPVSADDPRHCGACNRACRADQVCENGSCRCEVGTAECEGSCVDMARSPAHCGACGNACGMEQVCRDGACTCGEVTEPDFCAGAGCVALASDPQNCGVCGRACEPGQRCLAGQCSCPTATHAACGDECVALDSDPAHCGACDHACPAGEVCESGACLCKSGLTCGSVCVDADDLLNCGACGKACPSGQICKGARCVCPGTGLSPCGDACVALSSDASNCGECGKVCRPGETCTGGSCACQSETSWCDAAGACVNLKSDANHCSSCDKACRTGEICSNAACRCPLLTQKWCASANGCVDVRQNTTHCGDCNVACRTGELCASGRCRCSTTDEQWCQSAGACVDTRRSSSHCGRCDAACRTGEICSNGSCRCPGGTQWCPSAGACVDTQGSAAHCGGCDIACKAGEVCFNGSCECPASGQKWCASLGRCVDTLSNAAHCGNCDAACRPGLVCKSAICRCAGVNQEYCQAANRCADLESDSQHCGGCGKACPAQTHCTTGKCTCDQAGLTLCGATCVDLTTDESHCGACNAGCGGTRQCQAGKCRCPDPIVGAEVRLTTNTVDERHQAAVWDGTHVGVIYLRGTQDLGGLRGNAYFRLLNPDGTPAAADVQLTSFPPDLNAVVDPPDIAWSGSEYALVWTQQQSDGSASTFTTVMQRMTPAGALKGSLVSLLAEAGGQDATDDPLVTWSSTYGGYALLTSPGSNLRFQRRGATGTTTETPTLITMTDSGTTGTVFFPLASGGWGIAAHSWSSYLVQIGGDGSLAKPPSAIASSPQRPETAADLIHDGTTYLMAWATAPVTTQGDVLVNRGEQPNTPFKAVSVDLPGQFPFFPITRSRIALGPGPSLSLLHDYTTTQNGPYALRMVRFAIPAGTSSTLEPISNSIDVVGAETSPAYSAIRLVRTGTHRLLAIWIDARWGQHELYARSIDLLGCP